MDVLSPDSNFCATLASISADIPNPWSDGNAGTLLSSGAGARELRQSIAQGEIRDSANMANRDRRLCNMY